MIKFFRKIRKNLLSEGKTSKYFKYAIGEIILVVIGILIALQINNWNENQKEKKIELLYLQSLKTEFQDNLETLNNSISKAEKLVKQLDIILTFYNISALDTLNSTYISRAFGNTLSYGVSFNPTIAVQTELISSGNLKQINNRELRQKIANFGAYLDLIAKQEKGASNINTDIGKQISKIVSFRPIFNAVGYKINGNSKFVNTDIKKLFNSIELENNIILYQAISRTTNNAYYLPLKKDISSIITIINSELKK